MIFNLSIFFILSSFKIIFVILSTYSLSSSCFPKMEPTLSINILIPVYSIISDTIINYAKIDIKKLLEIEGEEDNVVKDGKVKLADWLSFAEKYGVTCEDD